ncbi:B3/4 domain-containing protein [Halalkalibacterium halodurans]|uniref:B3/B4 domain-containing protein n=1 Tax=Halalkalibacterium halodurans TaxID=86665 RepID=UPI001067B96C|nr:B3/4 domain-containing protein [Halalkalibacterium halodurans]MED3648244.1 B3/4 domain-containing protein [Halalkalibacterium halodurans]TES56138.1 hypothetical protein E2L07_05480 [Halalkalibacterium halodurans]
MTKLTIESSIFERVPSFKIGMITYHNIVVTPSPQMLRGRLQFFQEEVKVATNTTKTVTDYKGIVEWRQTFKQLGIDPSKYRPSSEALYRRIKQGKSLPEIHSAVDVNNFFSLEYECPFGIYDAEKINGDIVLKLGDIGAQYEGLNGRVNAMEGKLVTCDAEGPFGSPIVDSKRTAVTEKTTSAIQIAYLRPSLTDQDTEKLLTAAAHMFVQIHGGTSAHTVIKK